MTVTLLPPPVPVPSRTAPHGLDWATYLRYITASYELKCMCTRTKGKR